MRPKRNARARRRVYVAACAVMLAVPATAVALTAGPVDAQGAIQVKLSRHHLSYGQSVTVRGTASPAQSGQRVQLQFAPADGQRWRAVASARVRRNGTFKLVASLRRTGLLKVQATAPANAAGAASITTPSGAGTSSVPEPVTVAARFWIRTRSIVVLGGHSAALRGKLLPALAGRRVRLEGRSGNGRWRLLATARTGARGGFGLRYAARGTSRSRLRVRFAGDRVNTRSTNAVGPLIVLRQTVASWYYDGGNTACGFHAHFGVASRTLPCGTSVTFRNGGNQVTAVVDDRGPFVGGRSWDLNQNTAAALGFGGVGVIWASR